MFKLYKLLPSKSNFSTLPADSLGKQLYLNWEKWDGRVSGTPADIKNALKILNREPKDAEELARLIRTQRRESLQSGLEKSKESFKKHGY